MKSVVIPFFYPSEDKFKFKLTTRMFNKTPAATADMAVLPGVLGCRILRRTVQVRLGSNSLRFPGGTAIFAVSRRHFVKYAG